MSIQGDISSNLRRPYNHPCKAKNLIWHQNLHNHKVIPIFELISIGDKDDVEIDHNEHVYEEIDDRPIASRKGKRTCTEHSIHNFLSCGKLSLTHRAFVNSLDEV